MFYVGGFLQSTVAVNGQSPVSGAGQDQNVEIEFVGKNTDDRNQGEQDVRIKIRVERVSKDGGIMKAISTSTLDPKDMVCHFVALVS